MKKIILSVILSFVCNIIFASTIPTNLPDYKIIIPTTTDKSRTISDSAKFYLVTCEPGDEIYARFGHSAIRVYDLENNIDEVFHWGLFSFDTPNFIGRFISGKTDYMMGVYDTNFFMLEYIKRGSSVYAQELDITPKQKHELWAKLWENYRPENRKYRYNFIYDNCATRPYQLIISAYNYKTTLNYDLHQTTYRDIINNYVPIGSILNTGINLIIGSEADKFITSKESVAFPMYTMDVLAHTNYITNDKQNPIVKQQEVMHNAEHKNFEVSQFSYYISIITPLLLALLCGLYTYKKKRYVPYFTQLMLLVSGLVGIIISYLWGFSHHPLVDNNMNILWCNPLNIILTILLFIHHRKSLRTIKFVLSTISIILSILFLTTLIINLQNTTLQILSLWILILTINSTIVYTYKRKGKELLKRKYKK